ncbi:MAG: hypothetical protein VYE15_06230 [Myxococcota bacterium]|nr:hypothetical protein [Myxococcota bacterium]
MNTLSSQSCIALLLLTLASAGCTEWLEMPEEPGSAESTPGGEAVESSMKRTPFRAPRVDAPGHLVPRSPGLRVPDGYWTRVRMDAADAWMGYSWADLRGDKGLPQTSASRMTLRLIASNGTSEKTRITTPALRIVAPLTVPAGTKPETLVGLTFQEDALNDAIVGFDLGGDHPWRVKLNKLTVLDVSATTLSGTLEGTAVRGVKDRGSRPFQAAFHALRVAPSHLE